MRSRDGRSALYDAIAAGEWVSARLSGSTFEQFVDDEVLCAAVERKLETMGDALSRAERAAPDLGEAVPVLRNVIGLRNVLAHGYDVVDAHVIYATAVDDVPQLLALLRQMSSMEGLQ